MSSMASLYCRIFVRASAGFGEVVFQHDGFCEMGDAHNAVVLSVVGFAQQIMRHGTAFFNGDGFLGGFRHGGVVLLHVADVGKGEEGGGMLRFYFGHLLQKFAGFVRFVGLDIYLRQIAHCFEILLQRKGFGKTFNGIVGASHALGTHTVVLEYLEVLLLIFLFFLFRIARFAGEKRFKESHGYDIVLVMF